MLLNLITRYFISCPNCDGSMSFADWWEDLDDERCGFRCPDCGHRLELTDMEEPE